jgi:hypothetical protein
MPTSRINLIVSGPLFDGRADAAVRMWLDDAKKQVAALTVSSGDPAAIAAAVHALGPEVAQDVYDKLKAQFDK